MVSGGDSTTSDNDGSPSEGNNKMKTGHNVLFSNGYDDRLPALAHPVFLVAGYGIALVDISAGSTCPLCGKDHPHRHNPEEVVIYRNGIKRGMGALTDAVGQWVKADGGSVAERQAARERLHAVWENLRGGGRRDVHDR